MQSVYEGRVRAGAIVLDAGAPPLPDGSRVRITLERLEETNSAEGFDFLVRLAEMAEPTGIPDLATNIDHYLYGHPKVNDAPQ